MLCHYNGQLLQLSTLSIPIEDRGFIFGDGVYEVVAVYGRKLFGGLGHVKRLLRSLGEVSIVSPYDEDGWLELLQSVIDNNPWDNQSVYLQVTRGVSKRDFAFPDVPPTVFAMSKELVLPSPAVLESGVDAICAEDTRWARCDIKSVSLLPTVLLRNKSVASGADETVLFRDGLLTEGSGANIFIVHDGVVATPPKSNRILAGVTRDITIEAARRGGLTVQERDITEAEVRAADELWLTASPREVLPITRLDQQPVGHGDSAGAPGPVFKLVWQAYQQAKAEACDLPPPAAI
ncbi:aminotransferase class IV [Pseudomonas veronii]|uniref:aminotransferase class IV n=1 Tax=Pseudomonas veronii TaxID=76761 RepID=UPI001E338332|nr:aminotransferase class IV [Pseudomonas veronii]UHH32090.1 aminotransferase class IV [Pseudomonas veronii]